MTLARSLDIRAGVLIPVMTFCFITRNTVLNFYPYSPIAIPRTTKGLIANDGESLRLFWSGVEAIEEGLSNAIGMYIFSIRAGGGIIPWYVGKAEKQSFSKECFQHHKLTHYNNAVVGRRGTPMLTFIPKLTKTDYFSSPNGKVQNDISTLENMLIGTCLKKNRQLLNARDTKLYREMCVPGYLNSPKGGVPSNVREFKVLLGL